MCTVVKGGISLHSNEAASLDFITQEDVGFKVSFANYSSLNVSELIRKNLDPQPLTEQFCNSLHGVNYCTVITPLLSHTFCFDICGWWICCTDCSGDSGWGCCSCNVRRGRRCIFGWSIWAKIRRRQIRIRTVLVWIFNKINGQGKYFADLIITKFKHRTCSFRMLINDRLGYACCGLSYSVVISIITQCEHTVIEAAGTAHFCSGLA